MESKYSFKIVNGDNSDKNVALIASPFRTQNITFTQATSGTYAVSAYSIHEHDTTHINYAGLGTIDAIADDGTVATSTVCTAALSNFKIREFRNFLKFNAVELSALMIQADNAEVFAETITWGYWSPLFDNAKNYISLQQFYDSYQQQSTKILITGSAISNLILGPNTYMLMNIPDGRTVTFTFFFK